MRNVYGERSSSRWSSVVKCCLKGIERSHTLIEKSRVVDLVVRVTQGGTTFGGKCVTLKNHLKVFLLYSSSININLERRNSGRVIDQNRY